MKVLIAVSVKPVQARYVDFYKTLFALEVPPGTKIELFDGWFSYENKNNAIKLARQENFTHIFFLDDDQILPPTTLIELLARDLNVVTCNLLNRTPPFTPYLFDQYSTDGRVTTLELTDQQGLLEVDACGLGGVLVKTKVFDEIGNFYINDLLKTEDLTFSKELKRHGFHIYCALDVPCGHIGSVVVWPQFKDDKWQTTLMVSNILQIPVPAARIVKENIVTIPGSKHV